MQTDLLEDLDNDPKEFWKTIGEVGITNCQNTEIPMEVVSEGDQIKRDTDAVLERWKSDLSALYNRQCSQSLDNNVGLNQRQNYVQTGINQYISIFERQLTRLKEIRQLISTVYLYMF